MIQVGEGSKFSFSLAPLTQDSTFAAALTHLRSSAQSGLIWYQSYHLEVERHKLYWVIYSVSFSGPNSTYTLGIWISRFYLAIFTMSSLVQCGLASSSFSSIFTWALDFLRLFWFGSSLTFIIFFSRRNSLSSLSDSFTLLEPLVPFLAALRAALRLVFGVFIGVSGSLFLKFLRLCLHMGQCEHLLKSTGVLSGDENFIPLLCSMIWAFLLLVIGETSTHRYKFYSNWGGNSKISSCKSCLPR